MKTIEGLEAGCYNLQRLAIASLAWPTPYPNIVGEGVMECGLCTSCSMLMAFCLSSLVPIAAFQWNQTKP